MSENEQFHLPSGAIASFDGTRRAVRPKGGARNHDRRGSVGGLFEADARAFHGTLTSHDGVALELRALALSDFHVLRAICRKLGLIAEKKIVVSCRNCHERFDVAPSSTLELGPFRDGELDDTELDAPFDFSAEHELGGEKLARARFRPLTLAEAEPLHVILSKTALLRVDSALVRSMGLIELDGETDPRRIARRLQNASDADFDKVALLFEDAHYPPRLTVPHVCPQCGAVQWFGAPELREFASAELGQPMPVESTEPARARTGDVTTEAFPSIDAFEALVRDRARRTYRALGVQGIDLEVLDGPAECDDGGEPLLGCYQPGDPEALPALSPEIRLFYRTFESVWEDEGPYDVGAEIEQTLRHEIEHHLAHLSGHDPIDDAEHAEIDGEVLRRVGRAEARRRAVTATARELADFLRRTWPIWVLAFAVTILAVLAER